MKPSEALAKNRDAIRAIARKHRTENPRVFGSVVHGNDHESSDLDLLVDPTPQTTLMDIAAIQVESERLLGVSVDVVTPKGLSERVRERVIREAVPV